jgi:hypothetical protein
MLTDYLRGELRRSRRAGRGNESMTDDFINQSQLEGAAAVACSDLILPVKPFWFLIIIWATGGECNEHSPRNITLTGVC